MGSVDTSSATTFFAKADRYLMKTGVPFSPAIITRAAGTKLYDQDGREILDFTSGQMSSLLGHSHPEIVEVVQKNVANLDHLLSNMITWPVVELAERLARFLPAPLAKTFLLNTGSETTEAALKMAKMFTGKFEIVAFTASYHGLTQGSGSATYSAGRKNGGPPMPGQLAFPAPYEYRSVFRKPDGSYDWEKEMDFGWAMIDRQSVGSLAAFIMEPILSPGGILVPPKGYLKRMGEECRKRGMLIIMDEAQTGVGRTGQMFAFEQDGVVPDILCLSKTLGCGLPLASVSTTEEIRPRKPPITAPRVVQSFHSTDISSTGKLAEAAIAKARLTMKAMFCFSKTMPSTTAMTPSATVVMRETFSSDLLSTWPFLMTVA